jgi:endonuclease/exonuclease/phosphatase family metal-dependent hydrolase
VEIEIAGRPLVLFNVHITRPGHELDGRLARLRLVRDYDPTTRDAHAALVHAQVGRSLPACVLAGDLNATEWSHPYWLFTATMVDAFREAQRGWGNTYRVGLRRRRWHLRIPVARIDYVFHSRELVTFNARLGPDSGSEHLPVVADLGFR